MTETERTGKSKRAERWTAAQAREVIERWRGSGQTAAAFAAQHRISPTRLSYWAKQLELEADASPQFVAVDVPGEPMAMHAVEIQVGGLTVRGARTRRRRHEVHRAACLGAAAAGHHSVLMLPPGSRVLLATQYVDGRKGIDGLSALVRSRFGQDPLSGSLFVFFSKRADRVRVLYWDRDGYVLTMKRLERGRYKPPWRSDQGHVVVEAAELLLVLEGIDVTRGTRRKRWMPAVHAA